MDTRSKNQIADEIRTLTKAQGIDLSDVDLGDMTKASLLKMEVKLKAKSPSRTPRPPTSVKAKVSRPDKVRDTSATEDDSLTKFRERAEKDLTDSTTKIAVTSARSVAETQLGVFLSETQRTALDAKVTQEVLPLVRTEVKRLKAAGINWSQAPAQAVQDATIRHAIEQKAAMGVFELRGSTPATPPKEATPPGRVPAWKKRLFGPKYGQEPTS